MNKAAVVLSAALLSFNFTVAVMADELPKPATPQPVSSPKGVEAVRTERPVKIGYVDMEKIVDESDRGKKAKTQLKDKTEKYRSQIAVRQKKLEKMKSDLESKISTLSPQQRETKVKALQKKVTEFQEYVQGAEKEMRKMEGELTESLVRSVEKAAAEYGKANGFAAIIPKRDIFYLGETVEVKDVTAEVVKSLPQP
ncbi:OmpH family outer membrane protein [Geobacter pickeringii]|uniref:Molecular chaperone Skp n=1 Tax=Geobacter pickeringii TaxID=345632 RepID=A0A0B5BH37_9BACT|nr:OmpH family outer membrane protein [Geobacter pickeringii]AJE03326.1 molecular chaperone Skp [Geobacter pickeringii]